MNFIFRLFNDCTRFPEIQSWGNGSRDWTRESWSPHFQDWRNGPSIFDRPVLSNRTLSMHIACFGVHSFFLILLLKTHSVSIERFEIWTSKNWPPKRYILRCEIINFLPYCFCFCFFDLASNAHFDHIFTVSSF